MTRLWWAWVAAVTGLALGISAAHALRGQPFAAFVPPALGVRYRSNCGLFAVAMWWRFGGYVSLRRSDYWWGPHVVWSLDLVTFYDFHPVASKRRRVCPPVIFTGVVRLWQAPEA